MHDVESKLPGINPRVVPTPTVYVCSRPPGGLTGDYSRLAYDDHAPSAELIVPDCRWSGLPCPRLTPGFSVARCILPHILKSVPRFSLRSPAETPIVDLVLDAYSIKALCGARLTAGLVPITWVHSACVTGVVPIKNPPMWIAFCRGSRPNRQVSTPEPGTQTTLNSWFWPSTSQR